MNLPFATKSAAIACASVLALASHAQTAAPVGVLPLFFEANHGQFAAAAPFFARTEDAQCAVSATGVQLDLRRASGQTGRLQIRFVDANASASVRGEAEQSGTVNYFIGNNPVQWHSNVPVFASVRVEHVYPGVDAVFHGNHRRLEYDFDFAAGANPDAVALRFDGAEKIRLDARGDLAISIGGGEIHQPAPEIYQTVHGIRQAVNGGYKIVGAETVAFNVGDYNHSLPLVIDPVLSYSTYFGGTAGETAQAVAVDAGGNIYVAGKTFSSAFSNNIPWASANTVQTNYGGGILYGDAFVAKFDSTGSNLVYLTYLGGNADDEAQGVAFDAQGNTYVAGWTVSPDFPTAGILPGSELATNISGQPAPVTGIYPTDGFIAELNANGSRLLYSGYIGGTEADAIMALAVDPGSGTAFVTGYTFSTNFPVTANAYGKKLSCPYSKYYNANGFVAEIAPGGTNLNYSSYFGGTNIDAGRAIALNNGLVFVAGQTASTNFPTTNAIPGYSVLNGVTNATTYPWDAFVAAFTNSSSTNLTLLYSAFLGGEYNDIANGVAADAAGNAYVVGSTTSPNFPYTNVLAAFGTNSPSFVLTNTTGLILATNAFLTQIQWNGTNAAIGFSAVFGGDAADVANAVALAPDGNIFVAGQASSTNFPVTPGNLFGSLRATNSGGSDAFVAAFAPNASALIYSAYLGGAADDIAYSLAADAADNAYVVGQTLSTNFPVFSARQTALNGTNDTFLARITLASPPLAASLAGTNFLVSLPPFGELTPNPLGLESNTNLASTNWVPVVQTPVLVNGTNVFTFDPTNGAEFFRFQK